MADALLVFSPLQEISFFVLRSPYFDRIGVAPLLRRRLSRFTRGSLLLALQVAFAGWFHSTPPRRASSFVLLVPLVFRPFSQFTHKRSSFAFSGSRLALDSASLRCVASYLPFEHTLRVGLPLRLSVYLHQVALALTLQNSFSRRLLLLCTFF